MEEYWRIYCVDEQDWQSEWRVGAPSVCPSDPGHLVIPESVYINTPTITLKEDSLGRPFKEVGSSRKYQFHDYDKEIIIDINGKGHYTTIKEAITSSSSPGTIYRVFPGIYVEDNPLVLAPECFLAGEGTSKQATIVAMNPNEDLVHINAWAKIDSFFLVGAYGTGSRAVCFDGTGIYGYALVEECIIIDCDIGLESFGSPGVLISNRTMVTADPTKGRAPSKGVYCHSAGQFTGWSMAIQGFQAPYLPIGEGVVCDGLASKCSMSTSNVYLANHGTVVDNDGELELNLLTARGNMTGLRVGSTGTKSKVRANSFNILDSLVADVDLGATDADLSLFSAELDESKIKNPNSVKFSSRAYFNKFNKKYQVLAGDIRVGGRNQKSTLSVGEGKYDDTTMKIFSNDNLEIGTWVDNTDAAVDVDPPIFNLFQGTAVGNCIYVGRDTPLIGFKINTTTKTTTDVAKTDLPCEYWNGTTWKAVNIMNTMAEEPFYYRDLSPISYQEKQHVRLGLKAMSSDMALKTLNGTELYWLRLRVNNALPSIPVAQYIRTHVSESKFNGHGFLEHFGNARPIKRLNWTLGDTEPANSSPSNQDIYISDKLGVGLKENKFADNTIDRLGMSIFLPEDIDTSFPLKMKFAIIGSSDTDGDVHFVCRWNTTNAGSVIYRSTSTAPTTSTGEKSTETIITITDKDTEYRGELSIDLNSVNPCPEAGTAELLTLSIERDATSGNTTDTYSGTISFVQMTPFYLAWRSGGYVESF